MAVAAALWFVTGIFDDSPYVTRGDRAATPSPETGQPGLATAAFPALEPIATVTPPQTTEAALDAALGQALAAGGDVRSRTVVSRFGVLVAVTARLPDTANGFGDYVNIRLTVVPGADGASVSRMAVGRYEIPDPWIRPVLALAKGWLPGADEAMILLAGIESIDPWTRTVTMAPPAAPAPRMKSYLPPPG